MEREGSLRRSIQSRLRLGGGSSCSLQDLSQAVGGGLAEDSGKKRAGSNATWNSIHNAVIAVFQRKQLPDDELFSLNEGVRQLLKTELGLFFAEYLQNLLTKGVVILRDKIRLYEGQKLLDSCAETWTFFFCDILSMLQAIFYPVQGKEPSVRQMALLHFRNIITLNLKLDEALSRPRARVPPSIVQMLLVLQGVHESKGVTDDYVRLECLVQKVVSPYLSTNGLWSADEQSLQCCLLERHYRSSRTSAPPAVKNPVVRSKSYNVPVLTPVVESDPDSSTGSGVRRHSVCEMTSCLEESVPVAEPSLHTCNTCMDHQRAPSFTGAVTSEPRHRGDRPVLPSSPGILPDPWSCESATLLHDTESGASPDVLRARESLDSEPEHDGLFLNFSRDTHS